MALTAYDKAIAHVLAFEGGYVNDPVDPGGETNHGISKRAYPLLDIKNLTREQAVKIYRDRYWSEVHGDDLPEPLAIMLMDSAVNCGISRSVRWLQKALGVQVDGSLGPVTLREVKLSDGLELARAVGAERERHYRMLKTWPRFGKGWMRRLDACRALCGVVTEAE